MSDNEIENKEVTEIINNEVEKLTLEPIDTGLKVEELNFDFDDLNDLEEVYQDSPKVEPVNLAGVETILPSSSPVVSESNNNSADSSIQ